MAAPERIAAAKAVLVDRAAVVEAVDGFDAVADAHRARAPAARVVAGVEEATEVRVSPRGDQRLQLARQLTSMALNCVMSDRGIDCGGTTG